MRSEGFQTGAQFRQTLTSCQPGIDAWLTDCVHFLMTYFYFHSYVDQKSRRTFQGRLQEEIQIER